MLQRVLEVSFSWDRSIFENSVLLCGSRGLNIQVCGFVLFNAFPFVEGALFVVFLLTFIMAELCTRFIFLFSQLGFYIESH